MSNRIATLDSFKDDDDSEEHQAFYAGGSEHGGGQQILGPAKQDAAKIVDSMFVSAKENGAEGVSSVENNSQNSASFFTGSGFRLGSNESGPSESVEGVENVGSRPAKAVKLYLWRDGFSVDGGSLRSYDDAESQMFLKHIKDGIVPPEIISSAKGAKVHLDMFDKRDKDFEKPKVTLSPFSGQGMRLGNPTPSVAQSSSDSVGERNVEGAREAVPLDDGAAVTSLQIRLLDGSRMVARFNVTHRISDVRTYLGITTGNLEFVLLQPPNVRLDDERKTLKEANLLNAMLFQKAL